MDLGSLLAKTAEDLSVRRAFGTAYEKDGMLIIPVALVARGGGAGTTRSRRGDSATRSDNVPEADATANDMSRPSANAWCAICARLAERAITAPAAPLVSGPARVAPATCDTPPRKTSPSTAIPSA